jgi:hypothetical protein
MKQSAHMCTSLNFRCGRNVALAFAAIHERPFPLPYVGSATFQALPQRKLYIVGYLCPPLVLSSQPSLTPWAIGTVVNMDARTFILTF